jgi:carbonic anhydrase
MLFGDANKSVTQDAEELKDSDPGGVKRAQITSGIRIQHSVYYLHASQVVVRMKQVQTHKPVTVASSRRAISMHTGHYRLANGALLRVDVELGRFVGRLYTPDMHVKARVHGGEAEVHAWVDAIAARYRTTPTR